MFGNHLCHRRVAVTVKWPEFGAPEPEAGNSLPPASRGNRDKGEVGNKRRGGKKSGVVGVHGERTRQRRY
ncbi:hypothetical protein NL676_026478 [Syzygium grande]|nr:hypothetical protein NL676_026478 [Syzygium grande]